MLGAIMFIGGLLLGGASAQFMLFFGTDGTPTVTPVPIVPVSFDPNCVDTIDNCPRFGKKSCSPPFEQWAKEKCPSYCGICTGPTKPPPLCKDTIEHCDSYSKSTCSDPKFKGWAEDNCRYFCRLCSPLDLAKMDAMKTTLPPALCQDKVDCRLYGKRSCTDKYTAWAKDKCPAYCGFCHGFATPSPACEDTNPECKLYAKSSCEDPSFTLWIDDNCRKYCGRCGPGGVQVENTPYPRPPLPGK